MPEARKILALLLACLFLFACAGSSVRKAEKPRGVYHRVKKGETLWSISKAYNTDILDLLVVNKISQPDTIEADSVIFVPGADHVEDITPQAETPDLPARQETTPSVSPVSPPEKQRLKEPVKAAPAPSASMIREETLGDRKPMRSPKKTEQEKTEQEKTDPGQGRFVWPLSGSVLIHFGIQPNGQRFNGIRIAAREGTPVKSSAEGEVILSSPIKYYGETIIIKHARHYLTVYTFLKNKRVKVGDHVKKGQPIALLGRPENSNGKPYLHFEIRQNNKPRNPLHYLPQLEKKRSFSRAHCEPKGVSMIAERSVYEIQRRDFCV